MIKNNLQKSILAGILVITLLSLISASGVASPYWSDNPLVLTPGETRLVNLTLQNMVGNDNITFEAKISSEEDIAMLINNNNEINYLVPIGIKNVPVTIRIQIPSDAKIGKEYKVNVLFNEISTSQEGMLHVTSSVSTSFPVEIIGVSKNPSSYLVWILIGAISLVTIVIIFLKKKNKKSKK